MEPKCSCFVEAKGWSVLEGHRQIPVQSSMWTFVVRSQGVVHMVYACWPLRKIATLLRPWILRVCDEGNKRRGKGSSPRRLRIHPSAELSGLGALKAVFGCFRVMPALRPMLFAARRKAARSTRPCTVQHIRSPNCGRSIGALELAFNMGRVESLAAATGHGKVGPFTAKKKRQGALFGCCLATREEEEFPPSFFLIHAVPHLKRRAPLGTCLESLR